MNGIAPGHDVALDAFFADESADFGGFVVIPVAFEGDFDGLGFAIAGDREGLRDEPRRVNAYCSL